MIGFIFWSIVLLIFIAIGINSWRAKNAVGFFTGEKPPNIPEHNVKAYNHAVAIIWFVFGGIYEMLGLPLLFYEQNSPYFIIIILGVVFWVIGLIVAYIVVQNHYMMS